MSDSPEQENKKRRFSFFSRNKSEQQTPVAPEPSTQSEQSHQAHDQTDNQSSDRQVETSDTTAEVATEVEQPQEKPGFFDRLRNGLKRTRGQLAEGLGDLFLGKKAIDDDLLEELETQLLIADVGIEATQTIISQLTEQVSRKDLKDSGALFTALQETLTNLLEPVAQPLEIDDSQTPYVILMVGVNGVGKTTTIGKLAKQFQQQGKSVMLAAGDTFRAAAVEQLQVWGERNAIPVVAQQTGADSASVIYDAVSAAKGSQCRYSHC